MHFVPDFFFSSPDICLVHWAPEGNTDLAAFALLMGKLPSQVTANLGDVWPAGADSRALTILPESCFCFSGFQWPGY